MPSPTVSSADGSFWVHGTNRHGYEDMDVNALAAHCERSCTTLDGGCHNGTSCRLGCHQNMNAAREGVRHCVPCPSSYNHFCSPFGSCDPAAGPVANVSKLTMRCACVDGFQGRLCEVRTGLTFGGHLRLFAAGVLLFGGLVAFTVLFCIDARGDHNVPYYRYKYRTDEAKAYWAKAKQITINLKVQLKEVGSTYRGRYPDIRIYKLADIDYWKKNDNCDSEEDSHINYYPWYRWYRWGDCGPPGSDEDPIGVPGLIIPTCGDLKQLKRNWIIIKLLSRIGASIVQLAAISFDVNFPWTFDFSLPHYLRYLLMDWPGVPLWLQIFVCILAFVLAMVCVLSDADSKETVKVKRSFEKIKDTIMCNSVDEDVDQEQDYVEEDGCFDYFADVYMAFYDLALIPTVKLIGEVFLGCTYYDNAPATFNRSPELICYRSFEWLLYAIAIGIMGALQILLLFFSNIVTARATAPYPKLRSWVFLDLVIKVLCHGSFLALPLTQWCPSGLCTFELLLFFLLRCAQRWWRQPTKSATVC
eukprot:SAG31_NODE_13_length_37961_cov_21.751307_37_plen_530_part_00